METPLHPQTRRHALNVERLRKAAIQEFAQEGYEGAKISKIVALANLSQPSFYRVWVSKEEAYRDIVEQTNALWQQAAFNSLMPYGPVFNRDVLQQNICRLFEVLTADPHLARLMLRHNIESELYQVYIALYHRRFESLQRSGAIHSAVSAELLAQVYVSVIHRLFHARFLERGWPPNQIAREVMAILTPLLFGP